MAILALAQLQACSAVKLAYNNAPDVAYWWLDGYADLNESQTPKVRDELGRLQQWHRVTELPKIADILKKAQQLAPGDIAAEQVCGLFSEVRNRFDALTAQAEAAIVSVAWSLSASQIAHIEGKFAKTNAEWRDDWVAGSPGERQQKRVKTAVERSEQFYGSLEDHQLGILRDAVARSDFDPQLSFAERLRRQQDMLHTLRHISLAAGGMRTGVAQATAALRAYLERSVNSPNPAYRAYADKAILDSCRTFAQLHNSTTPEQRERAMRRLAAYERDARELAAQR